MSQHTFENELPGFELVVMGWDRPLSTYFAQLWEKHPDHLEPEVADEGPKEWFGTRLCEFPTLDSFEAALRPFFVLDPLTKRRLEKDKQTEG